MMAAVHSSFRSGQTLTRHGVDGRRYAVGWLICLYSQLNRIETRAKRLTLKAHNSDFTTCDSQTFSPLTTIDSNFQSSPHFSTFNNTFSLQYDVNFDPSLLPFGSFQPDFICTSTSHCPRLKIGRREDSSTGKSPRFGLTEHQV